MRTPCLPLSVTALVPVRDRERERGIPVAHRRLQDGRLQVTKRIDRFVTAYELDGKLAGFVIEQDGRIRVEVDAGWWAYQGSCDIGLQTLREDLAGEPRTYEDAERLLEKAARQVRTRPDYAATPKDAEKIFRRRRRRAA